VDVAISRTIPKGIGRREIREVEAQFLDLIGSAQHYIYIENQFLTCSAVAERLAQRLTENPSLEALIVVPKTHNSWIGENRLTIVCALYILTWVRATAVPT
jgi:hypothetical protein